MTTATALFPKVRFITHPDSTIASVPSTRYIAQCRLFVGSDATDTIREFDVRMPSHLGDDAIVRLLKKVTGDRYQVESKSQCLCQF